MKKIGFKKQGPSYPYLDSDYRTSVLVQIWHQLGQEHVKPGVDSCGVALLKGGYIFPIEQLDKVTNVNLPITPK